MHHALCLICHNPCMTTDYFCPDCGKEYDRWQRLLKDTSGASIPLIAWVSNAARQAERVRVAKNKALNKAARETAARNAQRKTATNV